MVNQQVLSLEAARVYLANLDLTYIVTPMCASSYPLPQWVLADAEYCANLYKDFLWLQKKYLPQPLVPTREIDEFWHNHILYTKNYFHDCMNIFGYYLHHDPLSPDEDKDKLVEDYLKTKQLYLTEFNRPLGLIRKDLEAV